MFYRHVRRQVTPPPAPDSTLAPVVVPLVTAVMENEVARSWADLTGHCYEVFYKENLADDERLELSMLPHRPRLHGERD